MGVVVIGYLAVRWWRERCRAEVCGRVVRVSR
ncbi:hypothetical protein SFR_4373 [Streptomyces sp. FR-008]|nr:hypothetical protein SFR_4373 [Streptomyces sp. FR-008]